MTAPSDNIENAMRALTNAAALLDQCKMFLGEKWTPYDDSVRADIAKALMGLTAASARSTQTTQ